MRAYYYGCHRSAGHYYWNEHEGREYDLCKVSWSRKPDDPPDVVPWGYYVDGRLQPITDGKYEKQGVAALHHKDGWTALAFWDYTVDSRPGSTSTFVFEATLTFEEALAEAKKRFPWIFDRFPFEVTQAPPNATFSKR